MRDTHRIDPMIQLRKRINAQPELSLEIYRNLRQHRSSVTVEELASRVRGVSLGLTPFPTQH